MMIYYWAMSVLDNALLSGVEHGYMQISFTKQLKKKISFTFTLDTHDTLYIATIDKGIRKGKEI